MRYTQLFPDITPPGSYSVTLNGHAGESALFCVRVDFDVVYPEEEGEHAVGGDSAAAAAAGERGAAGDSDVSAAVAAWGVLTSEGAAARAATAQQAVLRTDRKSLLPSE